METTLPSAEERFKENVITLGSLICELVEDLQNRGHFVVNPSVVALAVAVLNELEPRSIINIFISKSNDTVEGSTPIEHCWEKIRNRDRSFFLDNAGSIFSDLPSSRVDAFSKMFSSTDEKGNPLVCQENEDEIWDFFDSLVKISIKYIHENREPCLIRESHQEIRKYQRDFFEDVDIGYHSKVWGINLTFPESA
jgi:hypothetical protein